ncbi:hypothetical protein H4Q26_001946 [Puccinia striiformis f. sp. tritici PST-130]|nr:hypothetical protein H4Q26_001946 [Puccinia striiformis f. sp. tritici PST-130]
MISSRGLDESFTDSSKADVLTRVTELPINVKDEAEIEPRHQPLHSLIQAILAFVVTFTPKVLIRRSFASGPCPPPRQPIL